MTKMSLMVNWIGETGINVSNLIIVVQKMAFKYNYRGRTGFKRRHINDAENCTKLNELGEGRVKESIVNKSRRRMLMSRKLLFVV